MVGQEFQTQSADGFLGVFFCDGGVKSVKRQLFQLPASRDGAPPRRCRLLTPLALVFHHLKVTENGKRGERVFDCRRAPEAARRLGNADKVVQEVLTEVGAAGFTRKKSLTTTIFPFAKRLLSCRAPKSSEGTCQWRGWAFFLRRLHANSIGDELSLFSLDNLIII